jgi:transposase-like protein
MSRRWELGGCEVRATGHGEQRYRGQTPNCERRIFLLQYHAKGRLPEVKRQRVDMALKGSGMRDMARVLRVVLFTECWQVRATS